MLIKGTTRKGDAIPYTAEEALKYAVERVCKALNTLDKVYWVDHRTVKTTEFKSTVDKDGKWEAWAEGTAEIGVTVAKTDRFHHPKLYTFKVHYKLDKDSWGIPDIILPTTPEIAPVNQNPAEMVGDVSANQGLTEPMAVTQAMHTPRAAPASAKVKTKEV